MKKQMIHICLLTAFVAMVGLSITAQSATVAYWRFEEGPTSGSPVTKPYGALDSSGNGYNLDPWTAGGWAGFVYRSDVAMPFLPQTGAANSFSVKNDGSYPGMATDTADAIRTMTLPAFTLEAFYKPEANSGHRTFLGRDSRGATTSNGDLSALYFKISPENNAEVAFGDVSGYWHSALATGGAIQGFTNSTDPDGLLGKWYYIAAISDGSTLSLYVANVTDGTGLQLVAQTDMTLSGSPNTAMTAGTGDGGDWDAGNFSVGRGLYAGGHGDRAYGFIDEVRISDTALGLDYLLFNTRTRAWDPTPADGAINYGSTPDGATVSVDLGWNTGLDPANPGQVNPAILTHYLYMSKDQNTSTDPNLLWVEDITATGTTGAATVTGMKFDGKYLWRVDEAVNQGGVPSGKNDPNTIVGKVWTFSSLRSIPVFTQHPANVVASAGGTAEFTAAVTSVSPEQYEWFSSDDNSNTTFTDDVSVQALSSNSTLTLTNVQVANEKYYYCKAVNGGGDAYSNVAKLGITRLVAHWTLDTADYVGDQYLDKSGEGHNADPNGTPTFVTGQVAEGVSIARLIDEAPTTQSWANAGTWDPSEFTGRLTVSFWMKWAGLNGTWQGFVTKRSRSDFNNANALWQISSDNNLPHLWLESPRGKVAVNNGLVADQWEFIVATFDGATGTIYINGEQRATAAFQFGDAIDGTLCLGGNSFELGGQEWMNGSLDDVKIYNYALTELEVAQMFVADAPDKTACVQSLKPDALYDLNDDCVINLTDFSLFVGQWLECGIVPDCL